MVSDWSTVDNRGVTGSPNHGQWRRVRVVVCSPRALDCLALLCPACHRGLPDVNGVFLSVLAAHAGWIILSDSGPEGDRLEDLQVVLGEGPRVDAVANGGPVAVADLADPRARLRWPRFAGPALAGGVRAVFAFPVHLDAVPVGVLNVYRGSAGPLGAADLDRVARFVRIAAVLLRRAGHVDDAGRVDMSLPVGAGQVQQAVGAVMQHATVDAPTALHLLRVHAHYYRRPVRDVVAQVRAGHLPFNPTASG